jgi:hypothetical protein
MLESAPEERPMQRLLLALIVFGAVSFAMPPVYQDAKALPKTNSHDLSTKVDAFANYVKDFRAMQHPASNEQLPVLWDLEHVAAIAEDRIYAANAELKMYDSLTCDADRAKTKPIVKEQLEFYAWVFDSEVTRTTQELTFLKALAVTQTGLKMRDDLRAAKENFDSILASLK